MSIFFFPLFTFLGKSEDGVAKVIGYRELDKENMEFGVSYVKLKELAR